MKKTILSVLVPITISVVIFFIAISIGIKDKTKIEIEEKTKIVTTIFPVYDFSKQIAGDKAEVIMLLPPGTESHDYEPSPQDIIKIQESDLFVYTGKYMEVWAENIIETLPNKENVVDASNGIKLKSAEDIEKEHGEHEENEEHNHEHEYETHIWTNPEYAIKMCDNILEKLCMVDEKNKEYYEENAKIYKEKLIKLDNEFKQMVENAKRRKIISGSRFPFYYLTDRYKIEYEAAYDSCNSESRSKC